MAKNIDIEIAGDVPQRVSLPPATSDEPHRIGSDEACVVRVAGGSVSAVHAELFCDGDHWCLRDHAGMNGTYIDGNRLFLSAIRLEVGQRIRLGFGNGAAHVNVVAGAAEARDGVVVEEEVVGFIKAQKKARRKLPKRWKVAIPSVGVLAMALVWGSGMAVVAHRRAALRADPHLAEREQAISAASTDRLVAIMSGEARPEDVNIAQIVKDASFGRSSIIADAMVGALKGGGPSMTQRLTSQIQQDIEPLRAAVSDAPAAVASDKTVRELTAPHANGSAAEPIAPIIVDEKSLSNLIAAQETIDAAKRDELNRSIADQSRVVTLNRLRGMLEERHRLEVLATTASATPADAANLAALDKRLKGLGIDAAKVHYQSGSDVDALAAQLDPSVLENVRQRLVAALAQK